MTDKRAELARRVDALIGGVQAPKEWSLLCEAIEALWEATPEDERPSLLADVRARINGELPGEAAPAALGPQRLVTQRTTLTSVARAGWSGYKVGDAPNDWLERAAAGEQTPLAAIERWSLARQGDAARMSLLPALLESDAARHVAELWIFGNTHLIPDDVWAALCACPRLDSLRRLSVFDAQIGDAHIAALVAATGNIWDSLRILHLHNAPCTIASARLIAGFEPAGRLEVMDFGMGTRIGWEGKLALAASPYLSAAVRKAQNVGVVRQARAQDGHAEEGGGQQFGDVRSALQREPGPPAWCALTHALSGATKEDLDERLGAYVEAGLRAWPDAARVAPEAWLDDALRGQEHPALSLCRAVTIHGEHLNGTSYLNAKMAEQLTSSRMWPQVRHLRMNKVEMAGKTLQNLLWAPEHPGLTAIDLSFIGVTAVNSGLKALDLAPQERLDALTSLTLQNIDTYTGQAKQLAALLREDKLPSLTHLSLTRCDLADGLCELRPLVARLESLDLEVNELHLPSLLDTLSGASRLRTLRLLGDHYNPAPLVAEDGARLGAALSACGATLHTLDLSGFHTTAAGLAALCRAATLPHLTTLKLTSAPDEPPDALLEGLALPALRSLEVARAGHLSTPLPLARWSRAACWQQLERLTVRGFSVDDGAIRAAEAPLPAHLDLDVELRGTTLLDELARRPELISLRVYSTEPLSWHSLPAAAWPAMTSLTLRYQDEGKLASSWPGALADAAPNLRELWLTGAGIGDKGVDQLIASGLLPQLTGLGISGCKVKQPGALKLVAQLPDMPQLSALSLAHGSFKLPVAQALAPLPTLAQLHRLDLSGNRMGFEGRQALVSSPHLPVMLWTTLF